MRKLWNKTKRMMTQLRARAKPRGARPEETTRAVPLFMTPEYRRVRSCLIVAGVLRATQPR